MVSTKRQITRDSDRFGGYGEVKNQADVSRETEPSQSIFIADVAPRVTRREDTPYPEKSYAEANGYAPAVPETTNFYSTRESINSDVANAGIMSPVATPAPAPAEFAPRPAKEKRPLDQEDLMPSVKTRRMVKQTPVVTETSDAEVVAPSRARESKTSSKTKLMLVVYIAIALALAIAVIVTGVSISSAAAESARLATEIAQKQALIVEQEAAIAEATSPEAIRAEAIDMGMTYADGSDMTVNSVDKPGYPVPAPHTNGFDKFADWLSNILI